MCIHTVRNNMILEKKYIIRYERGVYYFDIDLILKDIVNESEGNFLSFSNFADLFLHKKRSEYDCRNWQQLIIDCDKTHLINKIYPELISLYEKYIKLKYSIKQ